MKKTLLFACLAASLAARCALATISITATPSSQNVSPGGTFNVTFSLTVTQNSAPANVAGFDLYVATASANSGRFAITSASGQGIFTANGPSQPAGGDFLSTAAASGFVRNGVDQGFIANSGSTYPTTPVTNLALERLTFSIAAGTAAGTYNFTTSTQTNSNAQFTRIFDSGGVTYAVDNAGLFSITVVPEPSTWATMILATGCLGTVVLRRRVRFA